MKNPATEGRGEGNALVKVQNPHRLTSSRRARRFLPANFSGRSFRPTGASRSPDYPNVTRQGTTWTTKHLQSRMRSRSPWDDFSDGSEKMSESDERDEKPSQAGCSRASECASSDACQPRVGKPIVISAQNGTFVPLRIPLSYPLRLKSVPIVPQHEREQSDGDLGYEPQPLPTALLGLTHSVECGNGFRVPPHHCGRNSKELPTLAHKLGESNGRLFTPLLSVSSPQHRNDRSPRYCGNEGPTSEDFCPFTTPRAKRLVCPSVGVPSAKLNDTGFLLTFES